MVNLGTAEQAIEFLLIGLDGGQMTDDEAITFLRLWRDADVDAIRIDWPEFFPWVEKEYRRELEAMMSELQER